MAVVTRAAHRALTDKGLLGVDGQVRLRRLSGGVSADVFLAETEKGRFVLKRPLDKFRTRTVWQVAAARIEVEADAAAFLWAGLGAERVPRPYGLHGQSGFLVMDAAPPTCTPWKDALLAGRIDGHVARRVGKTLGDIHRLGAALPAERLRHDDLFDQQRIDPYFRHSAQAPGLADLQGPLLGLEDRFQTRHDLVHGDFSPKNILTDGATVMLVDHEVVTRGDAAFDIAFFLTHLVLKAVRRPTDLAAYRAAASAFLEGHAEGSAETVGTPSAVLDRAMPFLGGCLVARVAGKSPVDYLDRAQQETAVATGRRILDGTTRTWADVWPAAGNV